jgi:1,4-alpha-glucan branching enzyme
LSYRIPLHRSGTWNVVFNSDASDFGGTGGKQRKHFASEPVAHRGRQHSLMLDLPPLAALVLQYAQARTHSQRGKI